MNSNCSNLLYMRNLQEQVKKSILLPKIVLTFHCLNKLFKGSLEQFFLTVDQNNFGNKIQFFSSVKKTKKNGSCSQAFEVKC